MEEDLFSMVAQITSSSSKKKSGGKEDILIDLMTKMSESYSKIKKENSELSARCVILENQNKVLKRQVDDFQEKLAGHESLESRRGERELRKEKSRFQSVSMDNDREEEQYMKQPVPAPVPAPTGWAPGPVPPPDVREERDRFSRDSRDDRERYRGEEREERDRYRGEEREDRDRYERRDERRDKRDRRDYDRERKRDRSRSRERSRRDRSRSHEKERERERPSRDKNDKIDLKDWAKPPEQEGLDPSLLSLKEKMKAKEEELQREENSRSRWVTKDPSPPPPEPIKPAEQPLPENRSSVKMSWGTAFRKTPDPQPAKKNTSYVGRMPWVKKGDSVGPEVATNGAGPPAGAGAGRRSKFGPPVTTSGAIPPPTIMTQAPTLGELQFLALLPQLLYILSLQRFPREEEEEEET